MKTLLIACITFLSFASFAQTGKVTLTIEFRNLVEGYDHTTKDMIYVDGVLVHTTAEHRESAEMTEKIKLPRGSHTVRVENWTLYEGTWELTAIDNNYSIDGFAEDTLTIGKKNTFKIVYDIDSTEPSWEFTKLK